MIQAHKMTPDGISNEDWDIVKELACDIVNVGDEDSDQRKRLFVYLDELENKYGDLPSIDATRGDFSDDLDVSMGYWNKALGEAEKRNDTKNMIMILNSICEGIISEKWCRDNFQHLGDLSLWLDRYGKMVRTSGDEEEINEYERVKREAEKIR